MLSRRQFVKATALAGAGALMLRGRAFPFAQSPTNIRKFVVSLPGVGSSGANEIGQYLPVLTSQSGSFAGLQTDFYNVSVAEFTQLMHPDLPGKTTFWGYSDTLHPDKRY